jgi:hypothetical protein
MLMVVNGWDGSRTLNIDFTPYNSGFGATRYLVSDTSLKTALLPDEAGETLTIGPGETAVYIFPNSAASTGLDQVAIQPMPSAGSSKVSVTYGYLYQQNVPVFGDIYDCTAGCVLTVDRRLGDVYFQYTFQDPPLGGSRTSAVQPLGNSNSISLSRPPRR